MRKLTLDVDTLNVQSFETARVQTAQGTVFGHAPTAGNSPECRSAVDACPSRLCDTSVCDTNLCTAETCGPTYDAVECPSIVDACPSARGCTEIDCI